MMNQAVSQFDDKLLAEVLQALGHPVRLRLIQGLCETECNVNRLWQKLKISQPLASQHLNRLRQAGIVVSERRGKEICYRLADKRIKYWLEDLQKILAA